MNALFKYCISFLFLWVGLSCKVRQSDELQVICNSPMILTKISGVNLSDSKELPGRPITAKRVGAKWVAIVPQYFGRQGRTDLIKEADWDFLLPAMIASAQNQGYQVMLKPHVDFNGGSVFRGDFELKDEADWLVFEQSYQEMILSQARFSAQYGLEIFCIGTELRNFALQRPAFWENLIRAVRAVYAGKLVFAANWDDFMQIPFWDSLDYLGINAYFPLSPETFPNQEELAIAANWYSSYLQDYQTSFCKPVLFTEFGFRSVDGGAWKHWEIPLNSTEVNWEVQEKAYEVFFATFWTQSWVAGGFLWEWQARELPPGNGRWSPQGKPAEAVIVRWYN